MPRSHLVCLSLILLAPGPALAQGKGAQYAFLVACSGYDQKELKPLPYTQNDLEEFRKALLDTGFAADNIKVLHDKAERRYLPERGKILQELDLLLAGLRADDAVVVALSGHGVHFKGEPTGYFCPLDAKLADRATLIPMDGKGGLFERLKACKAGRKLLLVNACRNDPASDLAQAAKQVDLDDEDAEKVPEGVAALYSCRQGQKSYYDPEREMGLFFIHLCKAWRGGYQQGDGEFTLEDVFRQVEVETKKDADRRFGAAQVPEVRRQYAGTWKLRAAAPPDPDDPLKLLAKGLELLKRPDPDQLIAEFSKALQASPKDAMTYYHRGAAFSKKRDYERAVADFTKAIELDPKNPDFYTLRAAAYRALGELTKAKADLEKAEKLRGGK